MSFQSTGALLAALTTSIPEILAVPVIGITGSAGYVMPRIVIGYIA
jgi:hypothetical protein